MCWEKGCMPRLFLLGGPTTAALHAGCAASQLACHGHDTGSAAACMEWAPLVLLQVPHCTTLSAHSHCRDVPECQWWQDDDWGVPDLDCALT